MEADTTAPLMPPAAPGPAAAPSAAQPSSTAASSAKAWKVHRVGVATFAISKPKRKSNKLRQMRLKNGRRAR